MKRLCLAIALWTWMSAGPAHADLRLCSRMSYIVEAAIGVEDKGASATRGWFRLNPGQCRVILQGSVDVERILVHARALAVYGQSPLPQAAHADLCVARGDFTIAGARQCRAGQSPARFVEIKPTLSEGVATANLAEDAEYDAEQARLAGIQRLLVMAGYDASPIDGVQGPKTESALAAFLRDHALPSESAGEAGIFDRLIEAAQRPNTTGFAWCNDTPHPVLASIGLGEQSAIVTRGWFRVEPGKCLRPDLQGQPTRIYSYAEAIDGSGRPVMRGGAAMAWGGATSLCTRDVKFELSEQRDCEASGLTTSGFATIDLAGKPGVTVRFKEPR